MYEIKVNNKLDLDSTLFSGQAFRWYKKEDWYYGYINNVFLRIREKNNYMYAYFVVCALVHAYISEHKKQ